MSKFFEQLLVVGKVAIIACTSLLTIYVIFALLVWITPPSIQKRVGIDLFEGPAESDPDAESIDEAHRSVGEWVLKCTGASTISNVPERDRNVFYTSSDRWFAPFSGFSVSAIRVGTGSEARAGAIRTVSLSNSELAVLRLSRDIAGERLSLRKKIASSYMFFQIATLATIAIGLITTILVSLSSTEFGKDSKLIRILAIVFPALGTAAAAVIAFYSPQTQLSAASHALASLSQLQNQIISGLWEVDCDRAISASAFKQLKEQLQKWDQRYQDIETMADAGAAPQNGNGGSGNGNPAPQGSPATPTPRGEPSR
jgi:hypothetical protein